MSPVTDDLDALRDRLLRFVSDRDWERFHTPKNLAMALAGEVGELLAELQWLTPEESATVMAADPDAAARIRSEVADVTNDRVHLAAALDIDLVANAHHKLDEVEVRYPPGARPGG